MPAAPRSGWVSSLWGFPAGGERDRREDGKGHECQAVGSPCHCPAPLLLCAPYRWRSRVSPGSTGWRRHAHGAWSYRHLRGERPGVAFGPEIDGHPRGDVCGGTPSHLRAPWSQSRSPLEAGKPSVCSRRSTGDRSASDAATQYTPNRRSPWRTSRIGCGSATGAAVDRVGAVVGGGAAVGGIVVVGTAGVGEAAGAVASSWPARACCDRHPAVRAGPAAAQWGGRPCSELAGGGLASSWSVSSRGPADLLGSMRAGTWRLLSTDLACHAKSPPSGGWRAPLAG